MTSFLFADQRSTKVLVSFQPDTPNIGQNTADIGDKCEIQTLHLYLLLYYYLPCPFPLCYLFSNPLTRGQNTI